MRIEQGRAWLGEIAEREGDLVTAERELSASSAAVRMTPTMWPGVSAVFARVLLSRGRLDEAERVIREVTDFFSTDQIHGLAEPLARLVHAEILDARGSRGEAREMLRPTRARLVAMASKIPDESLKTAYLAVPSHARVLARSADLETE